MERSKDSQNFVIHWMDIQQLIESAQKHTLPKWRCIEYMGWTLMCENRKSQNNSEKIIKLSMRSKWNLSGNNDIYIHFSRILYIYTIMKSTHIGNVFYCYQNRTMIPSHLA
jgi:hypothetical protein